LGVFILGEFIIDGVERDREVPDLLVTKISDGLGFGVGTISRQTLEGEVGDGAFAQAETAIVSQDILVPVGKVEGVPVEDDGCGDGREVAVVFKGSEVKQHSLDRYKVFGGGVAMAGAGRIGLGQARGRTLNETFVDAMDELDEAGVDYGAHTADHVKHPDTDSGCGAIDNAPAVVAYVAHNRATIKAAVESLGADTSGLDEVLDEYEAYATEIEEQPYNGREVIEEVLRRGKVVKQLRGAHKEGDLVWNKVRGHTVNQAVVRRATEGKLDVFAVDEPRMEDIAHELHEDDTTAAHKAFLSEQVYTLAVSAVLTPGDQRIYVVQEAASVPAGASR
jgi:hypothetical protein